MKLYFVCNRRFQQGVELIKGGNSLFQGILLMVVKDIPQTDAVAVSREFASKLDAFINKDTNKESFVLQMVCKKYWLHLLSPSVC